MAYNIILDNLPNFIEINQVKYEINSDFKTIFKIMKLFEDVRISEQEKIYMALLMFYKNNLPEDLNAGFKELNNFISMGKNQKNKNSKQLFSFDEDSSYIFSGFLKIYGINLAKTNMHWFEFSLLFNELISSDCLFSNIVDIRGCKIDENMSSEQKQRLLSNKKIFKLKSEKIKEQQALERKLLGG